MASFQPINTAKLALNNVVKSILDNIRLPQSTVNRMKVEQNIEDIEKFLGNNNKNMRKPIADGSYRTLWTSVTADNLLGKLLKQSPSCVAGGPSWQIVNGNSAENIVYWEGLSLRMAGLAAIKQSIEGQYYDLIIKGLEFRWGSKYSPESRYPVMEPKTNFWTLFTLPDGKELSNGVGKLDILYNDGSLRITRDKAQGLTYIHMREPLSKEMSAFYMDYSNTKK
eukprot:CAMPEP_0119042750 /NCGR_PEP_ID=MMETSP1177-20130426/16127_1 /TAXON_ID=2985 /ORGANISM="Ochromonas sp, Strain CCMP1899" /LENGTH=223 /DNA_ID=CAMNT_0007009743 /DNA_START=137 /DNA_END=808 /DNA_ORIENTATION=+